MESKLGGDTNGAYHKQLRTHTRIRQGQAGIQQHAAMMIHKHQESALEHVLNGQGPAGTDQQNAGLGLRATYELIRPYCQWYNVLYSTVLYTKTGMLGCWDRTRWDGMLDAGCWDAGVLSRVTTDHHRGAPRWADQWTRSARETGQRTCALPVRASTYHHRLNHRHSEGMPGLTWSLWAVGHGRHAGFVAGWREFGWGLCPCSVLGLPIYVIGCVTASPVGTSGGRLEPKPNQTLTSRENATTPRRGRQTPRRIPASNRPDQTQHAFERSGRFHGSR
jgi:hypothetical protein